ncbi:MAG: hypothetical protein JSR61_21115, partial [Proteobacteria bacterium]|nr:hypothetical protein [Pseudomonadota bacterium]
MFGKRGVSNDFRSAAPAAPAAPAQHTATPIPAAPAPDAQSALSAPVDSGRTPFPSDGLGAPLVPAPPPERRQAAVNMPAVDSRRSEAYYATKGTIFGAL